MTNLLPYLNDYGVRYVAPARKPVQSILDGMTVTKCEGRFYSVKTIGVRGSGPGCGKDTVADYIAELLKDKEILTHRAAFADGVREDVSKITDIPVELIRTPEGKNMVFESLGITIGKLLQYHGQAKKKLQGDNVWIKQCIGSLPTSEGLVSIISDIRYKGEQTAVKERKGIIIMVKSDRPISAILMAGRSLQHSSERDLDGVPADYTIDNDGTLEELKHKVKHLIDTLFSSGRALLPASCEA